MSRFLTGQVEGINTAVVYCFRGTPAFPKDVKFGSVTLSYKRTGKRPLGRVVSFLTS